MASLEAVASLQKSLDELQHGISRSRRSASTRELSDMAVRLEQTAEMLARVIRLIRPETSVKSVSLTPRELEVLSYLVDGLTNGEIAAKCWVSGNTVKFHMKNIFRKLNVRDRGQANMIARTIMLQAAK